MLNILKIFVCLFLAFFITESYAIEVSVHSTAKDIDGLGFTVDGKEHGGPGSDFQASDMPKGLYNFGLRHVGNDVDCFAKNGKKVVKLERNTNAVLNYNGEHCTLKISSK